MNLDKLPPNMETCFEEMNTCQVGFKKAQWQQEEIEGKLQCIQELLPQEGSNGSWELSTSLLHDDIGLSVTACIRRRMQCLLKYSVKNLGSKTEIMQEENFDNLNGHLLTGMCQGPCQEG